MRNYTVDLSGIENRQQMHDRFAEALGLTDSYGANLDALYDALSEISGQLTVVGMEDAKQSLAEYAQGLWQVLTDVEEENPLLSISYTESGQFEEQDSFWE